MRKYKFIEKQEYKFSEFSIVPLRHEDRNIIMKWRNEQIFHLRQQQQLTQAQQDNYFATVIANLFEQEKPVQILFSYLRNGNCIGYGGLVHINWQDQYAEISFIMDTSLEKDEFKLHWVSFLTLLKEAAFTQLRFHKIFTYAFDLRPHLYEAVEAAGFYKEAVLKEHCLFEGKYIDVVIHSHLNDSK